MAFAHTYKANPHWLPKLPMKALRHIPGEEGLPLVGNTFRILKDPVGFGQRMVQSYGRVYRNNAFGGPTVTLLGPEANELVLFDRDRIFSSEQGWGPVLNLLFPRGLMLMDFEQHRADRRTLSVAFKPEPMRHYAEQLNRGIAREVAGWANRPMRFYDAIKELTLDLAAESFLGMDLGPEAKRINQAFVDEVQASIAPVRFPLPGTQMARGTRARAYLLDFFNREIPVRRAGQGQDFFSHFCRARDEAGQPLGNAAIADHMNFLMMAAHDTITSSATSLVMLLGKHGEWQEKLRAEVLGLGLNDEEGLAHGQLDQLTLTDYAFKEALRMIPPVPSLPRRALKDFDFGGYRIPAGTNVSVSPAWTHAMPEHWPEPEKFDPMRFTPDQVRARHRFAWVPFGGGAHMCLGLHFAEMQIRILMVQLLRRYRIELAPGAGTQWQPWPIPRPRDGLPLRFVPLG
ncbi:cytochrome P450 [Sphingomonas sp.]|uniref:cytochrome P450 n=1 Tax=Sphingomonas sp. TaxID=28214 RepID=UPI001DE73AAA|nr:cytochrome P450 [Sphingomonas sp.]MBX9795394.1 cytochrome P450 [Sphingomonas sp.]